MSTKNEKKLYPLVGAQMMHQRWIQDYGTQKVANLSTCAALQSPLDFGLLKKCILLELERSECLRVRFTAPDKDGNVFQYISDEFPIDIPLKDLTQISMSEADAMMQEWAYRTFDDPDIPMYEFVMLQLPNGFNGFFLHTDHRLVDSCALTVLINDLMQLYCHYRFGSAYPQPLASFQESLEKDIAREENPKRLAKDQSFWKECLEQAGEPIYSDIRGLKVLQACRHERNDKSLRAVDRVTDDLHVDVRDFRLAADATQNLMDFCLNHEVSMTNLILLGLRTYLSKMNAGQEDISIQNFISRRSTHAEWTSGGSRVMYYPCRTFISPDTEFLDAAREVQSVQNRIYMHSNYSIAALEDQIQEMYPHPDMTCYESVWLTYQPLPVRFDNEHLEGVPIKTTWYPNGAATKKIYLTVSHTPDGGLNFSFHYQTAVHNGHEMEVFYYYLMRILFKGIAEPDMTIGDIIQTV